MTLELLEPRRLLSAAEPSDLEVYLVELINRARANPLAEAARYGIDLNEGLAPGTISSDAKPPLAINPYITDAARDHSQWMIDTDTFSHDGSGGSDPGDRMSSAGYAFTGSWTWGENIAWNGTTGSLDPATGVHTNHENLFVDEDYPGRGHRVNMLSGSFREVGAGVVNGVYTASGTGYNASMVTTDFARSGSSLFLTGVAYADDVTADDFYTVGEGLGGVTITATRQSDSAVFTTNTWSSGGYSLALSAGTYDVTASGGGLNGTVRYDDIVIGTSNIKRDFTPEAAVFATLDAGLLRIDGTDAADVIALTLSGGTLTATLNGVASPFSNAAVSLVRIYAGAGNDLVTIGDGVRGSYVDGGTGNDYLVGGQFNDTLTGGAQKDQLFGGDGNDRLNGSGGHDRLIGQNGNDRLYGGDGNDVLGGGPGTDRLWGHAGWDFLSGDGSNDIFYAVDNEPDTIVGGSGSDRAQADEDDLLGQIETIVV